MRVGPTRTAFAAALLLGATGLLVLGVQPLLYAAYVRAGTIAEAGVGALAAVEITAIAIGSGVGIGLLQRWPAALVGAIGILLLAVANLLQLQDALFALRSVAGFGGGFVVAIAASAIAGRANVNAAAATFLFLQAASQYAILQWFSIVAPDATSAAIQQGIAAVAAVSILLLPLLPLRLSVIGTGREARRMPTSLGAIALLASALFVGATVGIWAYLGLWMEDSGVAAERVAPLLTAALAGQMLGALVATALGTRHTIAQLFGAATVVAACVVLLILSGVQGWSGWVLVSGFGFAWMIGTPALSGLMLAVEPSRQSLPYVASSQLMGAALIPTFAGIWLAGRSFDSIFWFCLASLGVSLMLIAAASLSAARRRAAAA